MEVAVLGAGNGGQATAADLTLRGHRVRLYDRYPEVTDPFAATRRIVARGAVAGEAVVADVTNDLARAVDGAEVVLVSVPGFALEWMARALAPYLAEGQVVVLHPGGTGGALETRRVWREAGAAASVVLAETETLVYACRARAPGAPEVTAVKRRVLLAALPAANLPRALDAFSALYPQAVGAESVLTTSLANMNAVVHPATMLLNAGAIEGRSGGFDFYRDGVTPAVGALLEALDDERTRIAQAFGAERWSYREWVRSRYGVEAETPADLFPRLAATAYLGIGAPGDLRHRYVSEDVPMALVPMEELGRAAGVQTPTTSALITLCGAMNGVDYRREGRTLERLGLGGMTADEIVEVAAGREAAARAAG